MESTLVFGVAMGVKLFLMLEEVVELEMVGVALSLLAQVHSCQFCA